MFLPAGGGREPPVTIQGIPDGYDGTSAVIAEMRRLALGAYRDERINRLARAVTIGCQRRDYLCEAARALAWMQETFRYTRLPWNPAGLQRLQTPSETLFDAPVRTGECASLSTALAAILMSLGHEVAFRTAGTDPAQPKFFEHVWVVVDIPGRGRVSADPSYEGELGWEHPAGVVREDWPIST